MSTTSTRAAWAAPGSPWIAAMAGAIAFAEMIRALEELNLLAAAACWQAGYLGPGITAGRKAKER